MKMYKTMLISLSCAIITGLIGTHISDSVQAAYNETSPIEKYLLSSDIDSNENISDNNYTTYAKVINSYLVDNKDGTVSRIEYLGYDAGISFELYSENHELLQSSIIESEMPLFGGFYSGKDYNFIVFGSENPAESKATEIMRVVKYSKNWERIDSFSAYGANTEYPFYAGSLRFTESNGLLYIYTCHRMFKSSKDGLNHQSNMTYVIDTKSMKETQSFYDVMNISYGYASHSFNQFIQTDGVSIFRTDHGDAYPRGISITKCPVGNDITDVEYTIPYTFQGNVGDNYTGASIGGFELSDKNCIIAGNSTDHSSASSYSSSKKRNIFISVTDKNLNKSNTVWLTDYAENSTITVRTPHLVKYDTNRFLVIWEEYDSAYGNDYVKLVTTDENGSFLSDVIKTDIRLSDCKPTLTADNSVVWYVSDNKRTMLYNLDPFALENCNDTFIKASAPQNNGDVDNNGTIDISDAALVLTYYAKQAAGIAAENFTSIQIKAADINMDGNADISDAAEILSIYALNAAEI